MNSQENLLTQQAEKTSCDGKKDSIQIESVQSPKLDFTEENKVDSQANMTVVSQVDQGMLLEKTIYKLRGLFAEIIKLPIDRIDADEALEVYGIDSIMIIEFNKKLVNIFGELSKTLFFEYRTLETFAGYLIAHYPQDCVKWTGLVDQQRRRPEMDSAAVHSNEDHPVLTSLKASKKAGQNFTVKRPDKRTQEPIAIIGMSGRYPQAKNLNEYWKNLKEGKDCITEIPEERWSLEGFFNPDVQEAIAQGKSYSKWGGFVDGFADFDAFFFSIPPREAINIDPQERCFIESCWEVLEDAGYTKELLEKQYNRRVGVFAGINRTGFALYGPDLWKQGEKIFPYTQFGSVANRISYLLNLQGPSMPIDTMCSSSLTALHEACEHIHNGECEMAIAGGVTLYLHPSNYTQLCSLQMLSVDGQCKSFGQGGNGYVPGEGVGTVLLKRLSQAIADRDHIYAVIRGTGINHGGKTNGYTVPNPTAQGELIRTVLDKAGVDARAVSYIETHGTGTALGDPIEITGITQAFQKDTQKTQFCSIGSVKSNIGHLEAAAGIAGVTKIVLQMKHQKIVPSLHSKQLNPNIDFTKTPVVVQQELVDWKRPIIEINGEVKAYPRIAGISSFGAGGANAHVLIEEYIPDDHEEAQGMINNLDFVIIVLSAKNQEQLKKQVQRLLAAIQEQQFSDDSLADMAYTLQIGREAMEERLAVAVGSIKELEGKLQGFLDDRDGIPDLYQGQVKRNKETLSIFKADKELQEAMEKWIERGKYSQLMELWVKGLNFDWDKLYGEDKPRRISLPTYPFAKERYWVPEVAKKSSSITKASEGAFLHPLLQQNTSNFFGQRYSSTFSGQEFFLADHIVNGQRILPGVAYLEMARTAIEQAEGLEAGEKKIGLKDIVWANPIAVKDQLVKVHIALYPEDNGEIAYEIYVGEDNTEPVIYSQGIAVFNPATEVSTLDLKSLQAQCSQGVLSSSECYEAFKAVGIAYGPAYKGIEKVYIGDGQVLAKLSLPNVVTNTGDQYVLHPSLMDSALQASIGLLGSDNLKLVLPVTLQNIKIISKCTPVMWALIRYSEDKANSQSLDIDLSDQNGTVCIRMRGYSTRVLEGENLFLDIGSKLISPNWQPEEISQEVTTPEVAPELLREKTLYQLKMLLAKVTQMDAGKLDEDEPLEIYGIDSIVITQLNYELASIFGDISTTLFFEYQTLGALVEYFIDEYAPTCRQWTGLVNKIRTVPEISKKPLPAVDLDNKVPGLTSWKTGKRKKRNYACTFSNAQTSEPIAIIGMSGRYPQAKTLQDYWANLESGRDCITEIPQERWPLEGFFLPDKQEAVAQGKSYSKWGGFIDNFADFDPLFFNISLRDARNMDPQERLFVEQCWEVFEDAGYTKEQLTAKYNGQIGVFAGITETGFSLYGPDLWKQGEKIFPYTSFCAVANRVSYLMNLHGPSMPIDTMCSASLTAIHEACEHLYRGECAMAIAGGVNLFLHPAIYIGLCAQQMLSIDGRCKSFGRGGNGYVPGEGVGAILLKRLSQAIADEDHIYAVIRGTSINHGGKTNGYTVPNPAAQGKSIRDALDKAGVDARTVSYIEAHGTGTELGDPIEMTGLSQAFRKDTQDTQFCAIGSAKSNIGHLEAAAGIAGVTKIVLQMQHKKIVPSLHSKELNPNINFVKTPFVVQQDLAEWKRPVVEIDGVSKEYPRIAGISGFGAGGSNAHVVIEEYISQDTEQANIPVSAQSPAIIVLSAKDEDRLKARAQQLIAAIQEQKLGDSDLAHIAYTLQVGREAMKERLALLVESMKELEEKLRGFITGKNGIEGLYQGQVKRDKETLSLFTADEDMQKVIDIWASKGKYAKLLDLWVKGLVFDWNKIYGDVKPRRISLPAYPFAGEKFWIPEITNEKRSALLYQGDHVQTSEPLKGRRIASPLKEMQFEYIMSIENFTELRDSHNILHVGYYQEMLCEVVKSSFNTSSYVIENMEFLTALRLVEGSVRVVSLVLSPEDENGFMKFQVSSRETEKNQWTLHVKGSLKINRDIQVDKLPVEQYHDITEHGEQYTATEFYQKMFEQGFNLGDSVKWIDHVWHREGEFVARFRSLTEVEKKYNYSIGMHPGVLDACAQLFVFVGQEYLPMGTIFMVVEMKEFKFYCAGNRDKAVWCRFVLDKDGLDGAYIQGEYTLYDEDGLILAQLRGNKVKKLNIKGMENLELKRSQAEKIKKTGMKAEVLEGYLQQMMAEQLGMQPEKLDTDEPLRNLGMDSIIAMSFRNMVEKSLGIKISAEDLLQGPSIKELAVTLNAQCQELATEPEKQHKAGAVKGEELEGYLRQMMAEQLGMQPEKLDIDEPLRNLGMDSIVAMSFRNMVEKSLGIKVSAEDLLQGPSIKELAAIMQSESHDLEFEPEKAEIVQKQSNGSNIWYAHRIINKNARVRLFCVPYGGGGASMYRNWQEKLPDYIEVCPMQMPGKESRIKEVPIDNIDDAVDALEKAIKDELDIPYALYGHSMGSLVAYRLAYRLWQNAKNKPSHLFVGAYSRPSLTPNLNFRKKLAMFKSKGFNGVPTASEIEALSAAQLDGLVHEIGGMENVVVEEDIAKRLVAQALADFRIVESFKFKEEPLFDVPITAFHGLEDERVPEEDMHAWKSGTTSAFKIHLLSGNHFFLNKEQNQDELIAFIKEDIDLHIS
jgi:acyl transferase domain-containing protein